MVGRKEENVHTQFALVISYVTGDIQLHPSAQDYETDEIRRITASIRPRLRYYVTKRRLFFRSHDQACREIFFFFLSRTESEFPGTTLVPPVKMGSRRPGTRLWNDVPRTRNMYAKALGRQFSLSRNQVDGGCLESRFMAGGSMGEG